MSCPLEHLILLLFLIILIIYPLSCIIPTKGIAMIQRTVKKYNLNDSSTIKDDLAYWLSKSHEERIAAVDYLRKQYHGDTARLQRVARIIQRS